MCPHQPIGHGLPDLRRRQSLVVAVIPLGQHGVDLVDVQARQLGGGQRAAPRAADHQRVGQLQLGKCGTGQYGLLTPGLGEFQFGAAGVPAGRRPLGLAVAEQDQAVQAVAHNGDSAARSGNAAESVLG